MRSSGERGTSCAFLLLIKPITKFSNVVVITNPIEALIGQCRRHAKIAFSRQRGISSFHDVSCSAEDGKEMYQDRAQINHQLVPYATRFLAVHLNIISSRTCTH